MYLQRININITVSGPGKKKSKYLQISLLWKINYREKFSRFMLQKTGLYNIFNVAGKITFVAKKNLQRGINKEGSWILSR